jgi:large subunit ribosomal protein L17
MRHQVKKQRLARPRDQRRILLHNLATSLILHDKIQTTEAKAKALQPLVDELINDAKNSNKAMAIKAVNTVLKSELGAKKLIEKICKQYADKKSGYTRITRIGFRAGDSAPLVQIELA